jgi:predicted transcriptional regulator
MIMMTKNEQILNYIKHLRVGTKISVRQVAQDLDVSEGTAYKAIKDAEVEELVSTIPRVGTIRIEKPQKDRVNKVTFNELIHLVDGHILSGHGGIYKTINKFVIGAMAVNQIERYISQGDLLIVGNRHDVHQLALNTGCAILITGGFNCQEDIKRMANDKKLPIISTSYDTFTIASIISRDIHERLIRKEILLAEDILSQDMYYLGVKNKVEDMKKYIKRTNHTRFPVVDKNLCVVGIITSKDIVDAEDNASIENLMIINPITVELNTSVAYISHIMIWEEIEMIPVTNGRKLVGVITREDVIKGLKHIRSNPHTGEPFEDILINQYKIMETEQGVKLTGQITPMMLNELGIASAGVIVMLMSTAGSLAIKKHRHLDSVIDSFMIYFIKPLQLENKVTIYANITNMGRKFYQLDVTAYHDQEIISKAMMSVKVFKR